MATIQTIDIIKGISGKGSWGLIAIGEWIKKRQKTIIGILPIRCSTVMVVCGLSVCRVTRAMAIIPICWLVLGYLHSQQLPQSGREGCRRNQYLCVSPARVHS